MELSYLNWWLAAYTVCSGSSTICSSWHVGLCDILRLRNCHLKFNESKPKLLMLFPPTSCFLLGFFFDVCGCWHPKWLLTSKERNVLIYSFSKSSLWKSYNKNGSKRNTFAISNLWNKLHSPMQYSFSCLNTHID